MKNIILPRFQKLASLFRIRRRPVEFANGFLEGTAVTGMKNYIPDVTIPNRYSIVILGSSTTNCTLSAANTDIPLGVTTDSADAASLDEGVAVALFGCTQGTQRVVIGGNVATGDFLQPNGDGTAIKLLTTTGTFYCIGRALYPGVAGDTIEFVPCFPLKTVNP